METKPSRTPEVVFPLRVDRNGYRPVYKLGNEGGNCSFGCKFCGVGKSAKVTSAQNIATFNALHAKYLAELGGSYHPAIFNRGNVTDPEAFSLDTLNHLLRVFERDRRVSYISLNSRESTATADVLDRLAARRLPFPVHFIFGQESFSFNTLAILGKSNCGELERFIERLGCYNKKLAAGSTRKPCVFGLDVSLVFLPELYLDAGMPREGNDERIADGLAEDLHCLLARCSPDVPIEINLHPYYEVEPLPYVRADLLQMLRILPRLQNMVEGHNQRLGACRTHLFVGVAFVSDEKANPSNTADRNQIARLERVIGQFNRTGDVRELPGLGGNLRSDEEVRKHGLALAGGALYRRASPLWSSSDG